MEDAEAACRQILKKLELYLDNELEQSGCAEIIGHLAACSHCAGVARFEQEFKVIIRKRCSEEALPPGLEERVRTGLRDLL